MADLAAADTGIRQLHAHYVDAVWRQDSAAFANCFTESATWRMSSMDLHGRPAIEQAIASMFPAFRRILQTYRTPLVTPGDGAIEARTYVTEQSVLADGSACLVIGTYFDRCVDEGERWRFAWRQFEMHYKGPADLTGTYFG